MLDQHNGGHEYLLVLGVDFHDHLENLLSYQLEVLLLPPDEPEPHQLINADSSRSL